MTSIVYILADKDTLFLKDNTLMALSSSIPLFMFTFVPQYSLQNHANET